MQAPITVCIRAWMACTLAAFSLSLHAVEVKLPPAEDFVRPPALSGVSVSPSGRHLAALVPSQNGRNVLGVIALDPLGEPRVVAAFTDADIDNVRWVNEDRLVFEFVNRSVAIDRRRVVGVYAVDRDGSNLRELIAHENTDTLRTSTPSTRNRVLTWQWGVYAMLDDGSPDVIVAKREFDSARDFAGLVLARLNTSTGAIRSISEGVKSDAHSFVLDAKGVPYAYGASKADRTTWYWRESVDTAYAPVAEFDRFAGDGWQPLALDGTGALIVVAARGRDTQALYRFDPRTKKLDDEPFIAVPGFDLSPRLVLDHKTQRLLGLHLRMERPLSYWIDPALARLQAAVDAALPEGRSNRLLCVRCAEDRFFVVRSSGDREPGAYLLLDRKTMAIQDIARARPWIVEAEQARRSFTRVPARDGLTLPIYLTHPARGKGPHPTVVLVHGGPFLRGHDLEWDAWAAFLASRGYLVIEAEYRGSTGYGGKLFKAGWKQWGLKMQDDLADALAWAVREGHADASRACIMGASYGGYAALMGAVRQGDIFRCAVSFVGVTDINLMFDIHWSDFSDAWKEHGMPKMVGDPKADAAQFVQTSPLRQAASIKIPLLVTHGGLDRRVPIDHMQRFRAAAESAKVPIETAVYDDEGHGFNNPATHAAFLRRVETFLARLLAAPAQAAR